MPSGAGLPGTIGREDGAGEGRVPRSEPKRSTEHRSQCLPPAFPASLCALPPPPRKRSSENFQRDLSRPGRGAPASAPPRPSSWVRVCGCVPRKTRLRPLFGPQGDRRAPLPEPRAPPEPGVLTPQGFWTHLPLPRKDKTTPTPAGLTPRGSPPAAPRVSPRLAQSMLPAAMRGLGLVILALLLCPTPAHGLWCQDCTLTTNSSHCTPKQCQPSDTVCASVQITDPSSTRKDHSVNKMCAPSCDFVKRHFFSDYLMGFINSGILKVDVECCEKDLCNGVAAVVGRSTWALAGGLLLSLGSALLWAEP